MYSSFQDHRQLFTLYRTHEYEGRARDVRCSLFWTVVRDRTMAGQNTHSFVTVRGLITLAYNCSTCSFYYDCPFYCRLFTTQNEKATKAMRHPLWVWSPNSHSLYSASVHSSTPRRPFHCSITQLFTMVKLANQKAPSPSRSPFFVHFIK